MNDLERATALLGNGGFTCVLCKGESTVTSDRPGIAPMVSFISEGTDLTGYSAADKIIGKAAAMLFILAGVTSVYGGVMSREGAELLEKAGIEVSYGVLTDKIINRQGTDICPMEKTVGGITDPAEALREIIKTMEKLRRGEKI